MADNTWKFLEHQESNPEALKQAVDTLIGYTKKKGFAGAENAQLDSLELVKHVIICEAAALVLSDDWQAFMKYRKRKMRTEDQVITQFNMRLIRAVMPQGAPMIVVYEDPKDYPGLFVARLFDGRKSTHLIALADTLEDIREAKPERMRIVKRIEQDSLQIVEAWL